MKRILVKIGKVWSLIQRDGLWRATGRMWEFFLGSLKRVGEGEILFITGGIGDSALYRGVHVAEELNHNGFVAKTTTQDNPFLLRYINRFDVFVLHRVSCSGSIQKFMLAAEKAGKTVLFETDDLTFDPEMITQTSAYHNMNVLEREQYKDGQSRCIVENTYVEYATTTTATLARHLEKVGKKVFVVPNKMSQDFVKITQPLWQNKSETLQKSQDHIRIGYFSGSSTHDRDFAVVADTVYKLLKKYPHVQLFIAGPLQLDPCFAEVAEQVVRVPYVSREEHFANVAGCDINIAPLEIGNDFCESKSEIKFTEAGLVGTPTVASATHVFVEAIEDGVDGYVARDAQEWHAKLEVLIQDRALRSELSHAAHRKTMSSYTTNGRGNWAYYNFLRQKIDGSTYEDLSVMQDNQSDTAVIIANWNGLEHLKTCLDSLQTQVDQNFFTIIVDNGSEDGSLAYIKEFHPEVAWVTLRENTGFAHANNVGLRAAFTSPFVQYVITLNNDTSLDKNFVKCMRAEIQTQKKRGVAALQSKVLNFYEKDHIDATGVVTAFEMSALNRGRGEVDRGQYDDAQEIFGPSASAALYTREALEKVRLPHAGFFDKDYFAYYEDVDLAWRMHLAGYHAHFVPEARVYHVHSATGKNYSPFKAFHIHRNHYYNVIKDAPFPYCLGILLFMPVRYVYLVLSVLKKKGPSAKLLEGKKEAVCVSHNDHIVSIVFRAWKDTLGSLPGLLRKRRYIRKTSSDATVTFSGIMRKHKVKLKKIIFQ